MYRYFSRFGKGVNNGAEVLRYKMILPEFEVMARVSEFYRTVADKVEDFCRAELCEYAAKEYSVNESSGERSRFRTLRYLLEGRVTYDDGETVFVSLCASLVKNGAVTRSYDAHAWSYEDQRLIPPTQAARIFIPKGRLPREVRRADGIYVSEGRMFACRGRELTEIELK